MYLPYLCLPIQVVGHKTGCAQCTSGVRQVSPPYLLIGLFTLNELIQGRLKEGKKSFSFFLDIQKAYDSVWRNGLWLKLWNMGVKGKMWRVIKTMYNSSRSAVLFEGEKSSTFSLEQGVAQGCSFSPILFSVFISDLLEEIDRAQIGIQLKSGNKVGGLLFADDFVGITE